MPGHLTVDVIALRLDLDHHPGQIQSVRLDQRRLAKRQAILNLSRQLTRSSHRELLFDQLRIQSEESV